jgi:hypothetical protein
MKTYGGVHVQDIHILTSALVGGKWSSSRPAILSLSKEPLYALDMRQGGPQNRSE